MDLESAASAKRGWRHPARWTIAASEEADGGRDHCETAWLARPRRRRREAGGQSVIEWTRARGAGTAGAHAGLVLLRVPVRAEGRERRAQTKGWAKSQAQKMAGASSAYGQR